MPQFAPGETKKAIVEMTNPTASPFDYSVTLYMGVNMVAMASATFHLEGSETKNVEISPVVMPSAEGTYPVYLDVWSNSTLLGHYKAVEDVAIVSVLVTQTFYPVGGGVVAASRDFPTSYTTIHNLTSGDWVAPSSYIGQLRDEYGWMIFRGFVIFDTRSLPADSKIISAVLQIYGARDESDTDFDVVVQKGSYYSPSTDPTKEDFDYRYYSGDGGRLSTIGFRVGAYNDIELNGDGISWIKKAGAPDITRLALRSSKDINFIAPYGLEMVETPLGPTTYKPPRLVVTYQG